MFKGLALLKLYNMLKNILTKVGSFVAGLFGKSKNWVAFGVDIANHVKKFSDSPILDVIVNLTPTKLDDALLPQWRTIMTSIVEELGYAQKVINELSPDAKTIVLSNLASLSASVAADLSQDKLNLQQAIVAAPVVYDEQQSAEDRKVLVA